MDAKVEAVLAEYAARNEREIAARRGMSPGESMARRDELLLWVGPDAGLMLNLLARTHKCVNILEVGTSYGSSAVWLGEAAKANGGKVTTLELAEYKALYARDMLAKAGLAETVEVVIGDAIASINALPGPFDMVLIDVWKELYIPAFDAVLPKLSPGALIVADNMTNPPMFIEDANAYRRHIRTRTDIQSVLLNVGEGLELSRLLPQP